jgi:hypothetical protein
MEKIRMPSLTSFAPRPAASKFAASLLAMLLATGPAPAAHVRHAVAAPDPCTQPDDRTAFDVIGLKSELTVIALACHDQDRYNAFMRTYQPAVMSADHTLNAYFKRAYGRRATTEHDEYITNLASAQEQDGLKSGTAYCDAFANMFDEVMNLQDASQLAEYADSQAIVQPVAFTKCSTVPASVVKSHHWVVRKKKKSA